MRTQPSDGRARRTRRQPVNLPVFASSLVTSRLLPVGSRSVLVDHAPSVLLVRVLYCRSLDFRTRDIILPLSFRLQYHVNVIDGTHLRADATTLARVQVGVEFLFVDAVHRPVGAHQLAVSAAGAVFLLVARTVDAPAAFLL